MGLTCLGPNAKEDFQTLSGERATIEKALGQSLEWDSYSEEDKASPSTCPDAMLTTRATGNGSIKSWLKL